MSQETPLPLIDDLVQEEAIGLVLAGYVLDVAHKAFPEWLSSFKRGDSGLWLLLDPERTRQILAGCTVTIRHEANAIVLLIEPPEKAQAPFHVENASSPPHP